MSESAPTWTPKQAVAVADPASVEALLDAQFRWARVRDCRECGAVVARETEAVCYPCRAQNRRSDLYGGKTMRLSYQGQGRPVPYALEDEPPVPGAALRAVEAVWVTPVDACAKCADLAQQIVTLSSRCADLEDDKVDVDLVVQNRELVTRVCQLQNQYTPTPCPDCAAVADRSEALAARIDDLLEQNDAQAIENSDLARQVVALRGHAERLAAQVRAGKGG